MRGKIWLDAQGGCIAIRYSPRLFATLSNTVGARYDKGHKHWRLPVEQLYQVLKNPLFSKKTFDYAFTENELMSHVRVGQDEIVAARKRWIANPFAVEPKDISLLGCEVVLQDNSEEGVLALFQGTSAHKKKLLDLPYLLFSKKLKGFVLSSQDIHGFLKFLRDAEISFAVVQQLSEVLQRSAQLRQKIIDGKHEATGEELLKCRLYPIVDAIDGTLHIHGLTTELLNKIQAPLKKKKAISASEVLTFLHHCGLHNIPLWETKSFKEEFHDIAPTLHHEIKHHEEGFYDALVWFKDIEAAWITKGKLGGLIFNNSLKNKFHELLAGWSGKIKFEEVYNGTRQLTTVHPLDLPEFYSFVSTQFERPLPRAHSFKALLSQLSERSHKLKKQAWYHEQGDCVVTDAQDKELLSRLYPHQRVSVEWVKNNEYGLLGDDMGLGKTLSMLASFRELSLSGKADFILIICPNSLVLNWIREASLWTPAVKLSTLPSDKRQREKLLQTIAQGHYETISGLVVNFETARIESVWPLLKAIGAKRKTFLVVDESQRMKNAQSQTFKAIKEISESIERRFLLSGTPAPKDISDIWGQLYILDRGERLGKSFYNWLRTVAELGTKWSEYAVKKFIPEQVQETKFHIHEILLRRKKEEVISLPEKTFLFRDIELSGDQKIQYDRVREELLIKVQTSGGEKGDKLITSIFEEYLRAVQMASNPRLIDPSWKGDPAKFLELDEIVAEIVEERGEKLVVWTNYLKNVAEICERYTQHKAMPFSGEISSSQRAATIEQFQDTTKKSPRILVAVPAAGGVGITLTAAQTAVYLDRTWNAEHWMQSIDRLHRIGQKGTVRIIVLNACKVDELIGFNLRRKEKQLRDLMTTDATLGESLYPTRKELIEALK